jgi:excisionase family DNA binding protein
LPFLQSTKLLAVDLICDNLRMETMEALLTVDEVAATLRVSSATVRRLIAEGGLEVLRVRGSIRVPIASLEALRQPATKEEVMA